MINDQCITLRGLRYSVAEAEHKNVDCTVWLNMVKHFLPYNPLRKLYQFEFQAKVNVKRNDNDEQEATH